LARRPLTIWFDADDYQQSTKNGTCCDIDVVDIPNVNAVDNIVPGIPDINMPNIEVSPQVGLPGKRR
jgi:hypothetical protein